VRTANSAAIPQKEGKMAKEKIVVITSSIFTQGHDGRIKSALEQRFGTNYTIKRAESSLAGVRNQQDNVELFCTTTIIVEIP
jgi:hypothetical protein